MNAGKSSLFVLIIGLLTASFAQADHNSYWGEGTANMPNDIHNMRIDTLDEDTSEFLDFVRIGSGADSDNRFISDTDTTTGGGSGSAAGGGSQVTSRGGRS